MIAASSVLPYDLNRKAWPRPAKMIPMFSIDEYASSRFMSVCTAAKTAPNNPLTTPAQHTTPHHHHCVCRAGRSSRAAFRRSRSLASRRSSVPTRAKAPPDAPRAARRVSVPARLCAEAEQRQEKGDAPSPASAAPAHASKVKCQLPPCRTPKHEQNGDGADVRD